MKLRTTSSADSVDHDHCYSLALHCESLPARVVTVHGHHRHHPVHVMHPHARLDSLSNMRRQRRHTNQGVHVDDVLETPAGHTPHKTQHSSNTQLKWALFISETHFDVAINEAATHWPEIMWPSKRGVKKQQASLAAEFLIRPEANKHMQCKHTQCALSHISVTTGLDTRN